MKKAEWIIAVSLVVIGLSCLTMSATVMLNPNSIRAYLHNLVSICFWIGIPVLLAGSFILIINRRGNRK
jgi:hypothetical protein